MPCTINSSSVSCYRSVVQLVNKLKFLHVANFNHERAGIAGFRKIILRASHPFLHIIGKGFDPKKIVPERIPSKSGFVLLWFDNPVDVRGGLEVCDEFWLKKASRWNFPRQGAPAGPSHPSTYVLIDTKTLIPELPSNTSILFEYESNTDFRAFARAS